MSSTVLYCKYHIQPMTQLFQFSFWHYLLKPNNYQICDGIIFILLPWHFGYHWSQEISQHGKCDESSDCVHGWLSQEACRIRTQSMLRHDLRYHFWRLNMTVSEAGKEEANHVWRTAYDDKRPPPSNLWIHDFIVKSAIAMSKNSPLWGRGVCKIDFRSNANRSRSREPLGVCGLCDGSR